MDNKERGEVLINLGGQNFEMKFDFEALEQLDQDFGNGMTAIGEYLNKANFYMTKKLIAVAIKKPYKPTEKQLSEWLTFENYNTCKEKIVEACTLLLRDLTKAGIIKGKPENDSGDEEKK